MKRKIPLQNSYKLKKDKINERLQDFRVVWQQSDKRIFAELCFCICTPQSKAEICDRAISNLEENNLLFVGNYKEILPFLKGVRFARNKVRYIIEARKFFTVNDMIEIKGKLNQSSVTATRDWLVKNIKGMGYKEASHFLRNIGLARNLAILDRHVLKNLRGYGIIDKIPKTLTKRRYLVIEQKMKKFSKKMNIPLAELDLLLWSEETGKILK